MTVTAGFDTARRADARVLARVQDAARRRRDTRELRAALRVLRDAGLTARHARKDARTA